MILLDSAERALFPILGALVAGAVIGLEREWRGRPAGLRTHILVSLASALLMLAAMSQNEWAFEALPNENIVTDPTRMAHGVLTGIGFLCAGVIFRTGFSIHGLTTAASLWITSAIGLLFGAGLYGLGAVGTVITAVVLIGLRLISNTVPARTIVDVQVDWDRSQASPETAVEACLKMVDADARHQKFELLEDGRTIRRTWQLTSADVPHMKKVAEALCAIPAVRSYRLVPRAD